ncbi:MAG: FMN-binding glutamate synthase family protein [Planctomycetota bacterium]
MWYWLVGIGVVLTGLLVVALRDYFQTKDPILRNYPIVGHGRHVLAELGPKLRQYIVANNNEERPFSRDQRNWIYYSADQTNNYFGFGTDNDLENARSYLIIKQAAFPITDPIKGEQGYDENYSVPCAKILGGARHRAKAFRPESIINISAMSYGSLSAAAVEAINRGCAISKCLHNTGEGGIAPHHDHGGGLIWQLGTGYYGARLENGRFNESLFVETCEQFNVKAIEVKLSQGAKPGRGGVLPGSKITAEISKIRAVPMGKDCISPASHYEFSNADEMLDFVERLVDVTGGLPVGIKSAVGEMEFWRELISLMESGERGVDFIAIDGGEGGTGAAPLTFSDHVSLPFKIGFTRVFREFAKTDLHEKVVFMGAGKLGFPHEALLATAMGADMIYIAREAMMAIGCIQAQICQTGKCPTGVATQNKWLMRGLEPNDKGARLANYITTLRKEILQLCHACGIHHPAMITTDSFEILHEGFQSRSVKDCFQLDGVPTMPSESDRADVEQIMMNR